MARKQRLPEVSGTAVVADSATTLFDLPDSSTCKQPLQVAITEVLARHAKSYNADRPEARYAVCRCGLEMRLDGASCADDASTFAAHQAEALTSLPRMPRNPMER